MLRNPTDWNANEPGRNWHLDVFFGLHYDLHANAGDTELGADLTHEHLRAELLKVRPDWVQCDCKGHAGYTSWPTEVGSPAPGIVRDALRIHRDVTRELGLPLVMHYSGVWDSRAIELHPDWARVGPDGKPDGRIGATCNLSPYTDELMIPQMMELIDKYDVDGFWVDGENWATFPCHCDRCRTRFAEETGISSVPEGPGKPHWDEWAAFHRKLFEDHLRRYADAVHARKPACLVCSNWAYTVGHPDEIAAPVDYLSGDFTWKWALGPAALEARFMAGRGLNWDLMAWGFTSGEEAMAGWTFKPAAQLCQEAACVIPLGGAISIYDNPQRSGHLTGWHQDVVAEVARFVRARQPWCQGTESVPQAVVLHSAEHFHAHAGQNLMSVWSGAQVPVQGALDALLENHCSVDVLSECALAERIGDYPLVVVPEQTRLRADLKSALAEYVAQGGRAIVSGSAVADELADIAGVDAAEPARDGFVYVEVAGEATTVGGPWRPVRAVDAEAVAMVMRQREPGRDEAAFPAVTLRRVGQGAVAAFHLPVFAHFAATHYPRTRRLVGVVLDALAPEFAVKMDGPARVHLVLRRMPGRLIAHLVNTGSAHPTTPKQCIVEEVPLAGPVRLRVGAGRRPRAVYLAPSMAGLTWSWRDGVLDVAVASVGILDIVVIESGELADE